MTAGSKIEHASFDRQCLVTGDWTHPDFQTVVDSLPDETQFVPTNDLLRPRSGSRPVSPRCLILAQSTRNLIRRSDADQLRATFPKANSLLLLGSWCEGEMRSGTPLENWTRIYWHRWATEFKKWTDEPPSNNVDEISELPDIVAQSNRLPGGRCLEIAVIGQNNSQLSMVRDCLQCFGHKVETEKDLARKSPVRLRQLNAVVVVGNSLDPWLWEQVSFVIRSRRQIPVVAVMNFPRSWEFNRLRSLGKKRIRLVSQPFDLQQLQRSLVSDDLS